MEEQIMNMELIRKGDNFTVSEVASRLKISTRDARVLIEGLEDQKYLVREVRKNYTVFRLRSVPFINTIRLAKWSPRNDTFKGWL